MSYQRFNPLKIVQAFNRLGVEYVVIGGYASELHAAAVPPTRDIDFTPRATQENLGRLSQALTDLGARIRTEGVPGGLPFSHDAASLAGVGIWNLTCEFGELDISFMPSGTGGYDDLVRTALRVGVRGEQMPVASLADIIRSGRGTPDQRARWPAAITAPPKRAAHRQSAEYPKLRPPGPPDPSLGLSSVRPGFRQRTDAGLSVTGSARQAPRHRRRDLTAGPLLPIAMVLVSTAITYPHPRHTRRSPRRQSG